MQVGARHQSVWDSSPQLFVIGGSTAGRKALTAQFEQRRYDVACVEADRVADQMQSGVPAGVVVLEQDLTSDFSELLPSAATDIPRIVVGPSIDSPEPTAERTSAAASV